MTHQRFVASVVAGGVTIMVTGMLLFTIPPLSELYLRALTSDGGLAVARAEPIWAAVFVSAIAYAALIRLAIGEPRSIADGAVRAAMVGFLLWTTADFMLYGISRIGTFTTTVIEPILELIPGAAAGAVMSLVSGRATSVSITAGSREPTSMRHVS